MCSKLALVVITFLFVVFVKCFLLFIIFFFFFFFFKQKTAYEMRISDWSSDVCSSDLLAGGGGASPETLSGHRGGPLPGSPVDQHPDSRPAAQCLRPRPDPATAGRKRDQIRRVAHLQPGRHRHRSAGEIGSASCRDRVCQYGSISVVAGS